MFFYSMLMISESQQNRKLQVFNIYLSIILCPTVSIFRNLIFTGTFEKHFIFYLALVFNTIIISFSISNF